MRFFYLIKWNWATRHNYQCACSPNTWYVWRKDKELCPWCGAGIRIRNRFFQNLYEAYFS